ncbi:PLP-dependent transferase [Coemansia reversa NRRL 1564]|uniref:Molybdenum cofactor sulfurase n=1 Tax=Coemansia reversa (strain ATCC 12441 / NRRL 1564) TaxID=763665 RepID=A0A2G5BKN2_COERN|nr:PLP-dependent transferase [Coemansia reversa NRRL 1564]|eukprot:PIA19563.1 PLP-dependent transferase [Coemansia reversa NRRL 1564]
MSATSPQTCTPYLPSATPPPSPPVLLNGRVNTAANLLVDDYDGQLDTIRQTEYPQLFDPQSLDRGEKPQLKTVYLDHGGSTLYAASYIKAHTEAMLLNIPANPHSRHVESMWTQAKIDQTRDQLLNFLGTSAEKYAVVFTANATASIRLAAELTPITPDGKFCFTRASHTSVVGVRNLVNEMGASVCPIEFNEIPDVVAPEATNGTNLLAYPAQCNFSGERFPLDVANTIANAYADTEGHPPWWVLVDTAAYAASSPLNLDQLTAGPDFIALSMYKIFGAPTGLGVLLVRRSSIPYLRPKGYFGGGTVSGIAFDREWQVYRSDIESRLEDGTLNFQGILSLQHALDAHSRIYHSMENVARHAQSITAYAQASLRSLTHSNGRPLCDIYGHTSNADYGPTIAFNIKDNSGRFVGFVEVERLAVMAGISMRSGRFCNPGAAQGWLHLPTSELIRHSSMGLVCGDDNDLIEGNPIGALRVSFGAMTSKQDVDVLIEFLKWNFCNYSIMADPVSGMLCTTSTDAGKAIHGHKASSLQAEVEEVVIYPIKSCHGWIVPRNMAWEITQYGLRFDRLFVIMRENSTVPMQQKRYPAMALIRPRINAAKSALILEASGHAPVEVSLRPEQLHLEDIESCVCNSHVQAMRVRLKNISFWLSAVLSVSCYLACDPRLLVSNITEHAQLKLSADNVHLARPGMSFANQAQILMVTCESARQVEDWITQEYRFDTAMDKAEIGPMQYRPNIIIKSRSTGARKIRPFEELSWEAVTINGAKFSVIGPCRRCQMISIHQDSAKRLKEPYSTLARKMRVDGKVVFGVYLKTNNNSDFYSTEHCSTIRAGAVLDVYSG